MVATSTERLVDTNGVRLRVTEAGERGAPVVILAHGFPELAYSWRHQIPVLAEAGYHVLAPDQRGYGGSSRPEAIEDYDIHQLTADLVGLLDDVGAERAAWVGHDWGAVVVWNAPLLHPDRVAAVAGLSVPVLPRAQVPPIQAFRQRFGEHFFYILYFQQPGVADAELNGDPARTMRRMIGGQRSPTDQGAALRMVAPGPEASSTDCRSPTRRPAGSVATSWIITSASSPAPDSPAGSTGTAISTATGKPPPISRAPPSRFRRCSWPAQRIRCCLSPVAIGHRK